VTGKVNKFICFMYCGRHLRSSSRQAPWRRELSAEREELERVRDITAADETSSTMLNQF
jgi:hypothetical protein